LHTIAVQHNRMDMDAHGGGGEVEADAVDVCDCTRLCFKKSHNTVKKWLISNRTPPTIVGTIFAAVDELLVVAVEVDVFDDTLLVAR
jgi:hypothetical protein